MSERSQFQLLREHRFGPFFGVQFLGAFNDNVFKQALLIMLAYQPALTTMSSNTLQNVAQALFILPFVLFSAVAGELADKYDKARLITITVALELALMALGAVGLLTQNLPLLLGALFLGGVQSTLFGPVKYAILPQQLKESELIGGNALVESGTSIAVLLGMIYGGWLIAQSEWGTAAVAALAIVLFWTVSFLEFVSLQARAFRPKPPRLLLCTQQSPDCGVIGGSIRTGRSAGWALPGIFRHRQMRLDLPCLSRTRWQP